MTQDSWLANNWLKLVAVFLALLIIVTFLTVAAHTPADDKTYGNTTHLQELSENRTVIFYSCEENWYHDTRTNQTYHLPEGEHISCDSMDEYLGRTRAPQTLNDSRPSN